MENRSSSGKWRAPLIEFKRRVPPKIKFCHYLLTLRSFQTYDAVFQCSTKRDIWKKNEDSSALYIFSPTIFAFCFSPSSLDSLTYWIIFTMEASFCPWVEKSTNNFFSRNSAFFCFFVFWNWVFILQFEHFFPHNSEKKKLHSETNSEFWLSCNFEFKSHNSEFLSLHSTVLFVCLFIYYIILI